MPFWKEPKRPQYASNLSATQWEILRKLLPKPAVRGRKPIDRRKILNAILDVVRTGCPWRGLPHDFPHWNTVYRVFRDWRTSGLWKTIPDRLREMVRQSADQKPTPTAASNNSQSVKTAEGGEQRGYDGGKKITGRKRHIAVDTLGLPLVAVVHTAALQDYEGAHFVLHRIQGTFRRLKVVFADRAYAKCGLPEWVQTVCRIVLQPVLRPFEVKGFVILPKRWIVERTFGWLSRPRRLSKDYERLTDHSEAMIYLAMISLMSRRLAKAKP